MSDTADYTEVLNGTVDEVNAYVADHPEQRDAVLEQERTGKARVGILNTGEPTPAETPATTDGLPADVETKGATFAEAAKAVAHTDDKGYVGTSPERERTGLADKGLSQQSPGVLDGKTPVPDSRPMVDDSDALKG